ncbi:MAG TPA: PEP-CTERM sorting domain-containing protein [Fibrobacteria bacterium]|nr:PEP-CTERM sorting domain-containing protein [Fibrobacteria bacterium]
MNRTFSSTVVALLLAGNSALALPVYTFAGSVTSSNYAGIRVGQGVAYCFRVDFNEMGYYYNKGYGQRLYLSELDNGLLDEYFVADYLHGSAIPADIPREDWTWDDSFWEFHMVAQSPTGGVAFYGSNLDRSGKDMIAITGPGYLSEWTVGQSVSGRNTVFGWPSGEYLEVLSSLTLVAVSEDQPAVPEPSAMALFGLGLIGLTGGILRKSKSA